jgi:hypothetical protein
LDEDKAAYCGGCRVLNPVPPCQGCPFARPALLPENEDIWQLWARAQTQWRTAGPVLIGLDYLAVERLGSWLGVTVGTPRVLDGLQSLERMYLSWLRQRTDGS